MEIDQPVFSAASACLLCLCAPGLPALSEGGGPKGRREWPFVRRIPSQSASLPAPPKGEPRLLKKPRRVRCVSSEKVQNRFRPRRTPGWLLLPLRGNSPSVPGRKYISGCKCGASRSESNGTIASGNCSIMYGICSPMANKLCAQQTAKNWRKSPKGFFDKLNPLRM